MTTGQKVSISLLISVLIFAIFTISAFAGLFDIIEVNFYQPSVKNNALKQIENISKATENYIDIQIERFVTFIKNENIKKTASSTQTKNVIEQRSFLSETLLSETSGLVGFRLIDENGKRIHYSNFQTDILRKTDTSISYKNYDTLEKISYEKIACSKNEKFKFTVDSENDLLLFSLPFFDEYEIYKGSFVFYISENDYFRFLVKKNIVSFSENLLILANNNESTFVFGLPFVNETNIVSEILLSVNNKQENIFRFVDNTNNVWILLENSEYDYAKIIKVFREQDFKFSQNVKVLLLICIFVTLFLTVFILFNIRQDKMILFQDKIKRFQFSILNEYFEKKSEYNWDQIANELSSRKDDVNNQLKKSLGFNAKKYEKEIDAHLEKTWEEIISSLGHKQSSVNKIGDVSEIKLLLEELLKEKIVIQNSIVSPVKIDNIEDMEEISEVDDVDDVEEISELIDVDDVEEISELTEVDDVEEISEVIDVDDVEEISEVIDIDDVEEISE
ncbi:MAG: hypothetical protein GX220_02135, partial [Treponema sp.]|nr:hypothetical protein [Treponema sp.]